ncbi:MAG: glycosyltransferase family 4 protein [Kiritimatiellae bacterium]|nr:glycosyltransferase family 4 protein [Kiritimatiellia bacterium]
MKILVYLEKASVRGGIETFAESHVARLRSGGAEVDVLDAVPRDFSPYAEIFVHKCTRVSDLERFPPGRTVLYVHDHSMTCPRGYAYTPFLRNCRRRGGLFPCLFCAPLCRSWRDALGRVFSQKRRIAAMSRMKRIVVISSFMKSRLVLNGIPPALVRVEPPAIALAPPGPAAIPDVDVLFAGQLVRGKGVQLLLEAMALAGPSRTLDVVGSGNFEARLKALAESLGIAARVRWRGFRPDPQDWMRKARCVVVPSFWQEPYGLVAAEAVALGRPVVAFAVGGLPEACRGAGRLVPPGDVRSLARAIDET